MMMIWTSVGPEKVLEHESFNHRVSTTLWFETA